MFRLIVARVSYSTYITVFYLLASLVLVGLLATVWVAVILKGDDTNSTWLRRCVQTALPATHACCAWRTLAHAA